MLIASAVLFALAAIGGLAMAYIRIRTNSNPPGALAALHGIAAATALVILLWAVVQSSVGTVGAWALGLFVAAALGGFYLVSFHVRKQRLPVPVVVVHGLVAAAAFVLLLAAIAPF